MFFDSHAHLDDEKFDGDRDTVASSLSEWEISGILNVCSSIEKIDICVELAQKYDRIFAAVGVHPHEAASATDEVFARVKNAAGHPKIRAYGEIGLDYYYDFSPRDVQRKVFEAQIDIAYELNLPIVVHNRDAHQDVYDILKAHRDKIHGGMMHMFSGSWEMAKSFMDLGLHISLGGPVTFKNAVTPVEIAKKMPLDRLLIETDCPYMSPHPLRGTRNHPGNVRIIAQKIAEIRGISVSDLAQSLGMVIAEIRGRRPEFRSDNPTSEI